MFIQDRCLAVWWMIVNMNPWCCFFQYLRTNARYNGFWSWFQSFVLWLGLVPAICANYAVSDGWVGMCCFWIILNQPTICSDALFWMETRSDCLNHFVLSELPLTMMCRAPKVTAPVSDFHTHHWNLKFVGVRVFGGWTWPNMIAQLLPTQRSKRLKWWLSPTRGTSECSAASSSQLGLQFHDEDLIRAAGRRRCGAMFSARQVEIKEGQRVAVLGFDSTLTHVQLL